MSTEKLNRCLWGLLTVLGSDPGPDSWWSRAKARPWVSSFPQSTLPQLALLAGLVGLQVPWVTLLTCCQLYQVHTLKLAKEGLGIVWPYIKSKPIYTTMEQTRT